MQNITKPEFDAIYALAMMWDQYCDTEFTHYHMSAGEQAQLVLDRYGILIHGKHGARVDWEVLNGLQKYII